jgi:hypothetical protein
MRRGRGDAVPSSREKLEKTASGPPQSSLIYKEKR